MKVPDRVRERVLELKQRVEPRVRDFEWTWATAVLFSVMAVIPSFWLYFAEQTLGWDGLSGTSDWRPLARDAVAAGLNTGPFITLVVLMAIMQNWRRKLRGGSSERVGGGYR
jgi:hypothetical protein